MNRNREAKTEYDVIVIGAGPGGLSAAKAAKRAGAKRVAVLEREHSAGGILNQCLHDGFGIVRYGAQLSGPEYAEIEQGMAQAEDVDILTGHMVTEILPVFSGDPPEPAQSDGAGQSIDTERNRSAGLCVTTFSQKGQEQLRAKAVVLATGCRERTRGMLSIPGSRPAGIYTAGVAQNLINLKNVMIGKRVVILGSGDIGLIMARRLTLEGAEVLCACEVMDQPSGLARNVRQCLFDFGIPLYLKTTVTDIIGKRRLEAVVLSSVDEDLRPIPGTERRIDCDTLVLSVGLIPENEVAQTAKVSLDPRGGAATDEFLQTDVPGIFACGNCRSVMDLADFVSEQGEAAGRNAAAYAAGEPMRPWMKNPHNIARKGMPEEGSVTCTICPKGCQVRAVREPRLKNTGENFRLERQEGMAGGARPARQEAVDGKARSARQESVDGGVWSARQEAVDSGARPARQEAVDGKDRTEEQEMIITGNGCPRGEAFARQEMTDPRRILTTTVRIAGGSGPAEEERLARISPAQDQLAQGTSVQDHPVSGTGARQLLPVRSDRPVPLREMRQLVRQLQEIVIEIPPEGIRRGSVLVRDLGSEHADIISERSVR